jgi:hypothetical protein
MVFPSDCARNLQRLVMSSYDANPKLGGGTFHAACVLEMLDFSLAVLHTQSPFHHLNFECYLPRFGS